MQLWGPVLLAIGLGFFTSRVYYTKIYRDLDKQSFAVFMFSLFAIAAGIAHVQAHNVWETAPQIIVSFLGWGLLLKGIVFAVAPRFVDRTAEWEAKAKLIPVAGALMLILGAYLTVIGYGMNTYKTSSHTMNHHMLGQHTMPNNQMMSNSKNSPYGMSMTDVMMSMDAELRGKTGDVFDQAFISEMIIHHQGAVEMAELALTNAKHQEIKDLARAIIEAQNREIVDMKAWQKSWYSK